jgi:uncharacterized protein
LYKPKEGAVLFTEMISKDPVATKDFLEKVFGWVFEKRPGEGPDIWLFAAGNGPGGHLMAQMGDSPIGTMNYVLVKSVTAVTKKIVKNGGTILVPRLKIPGAGWFSMYEMPGGVRQAVFQPQAPAKRRK